MSSGNTVNRINTKPVGKRGEIVEKNLKTHSVTLARTVPQPYVIRYLNGQCFIVIDSMLSVVFLPLYDV